MSLFRATTRKLLNSTLLRATPRQFCTQNEANDPKSGYAKAYEKFEGLVEKKPEEDHTFASLLRKSPFIDVSFAIIQITMVNLRCCCRWVTPKVK